MTDREEAAARLRAIGSRELTDDEWEQLCGPNPGPIPDGLARCNYCGETVIDGSEAARTDRRDS